MESYKCTHQGTKTENDNLIDIYSFKSELINQHYIIEVVNIEYDIYIVQFYLKCHRLSDNRFNLFVPKKIYVGKDKNIHNKHVFLLLNTLTILATNIIEKNKIASFGFMGAPTPFEQNYKKNKENINADKTVKKTKRHRVYSLFIKRYFPPNKFIHIEYIDSSCYLLKNTENLELTKAIADNVLNKIISEKIAH